MRQHHKWRTVNCSVCGQAFEASRHDAKFCSSTCRTKARRATQAKDKAIARARAAIDDLMQYCSSPSAADCMREVFGWFLNPDEKREFRYEIVQVTDGEKRG